MWRIAHRPDCPIRTGESALSQRACSGSPTSSSSNPPTPAPAEEDESKRKLHHRRGVIVGAGERPEVGELLGDEFVTAYTAMRRHELQRFADHVTDWEQKEYWSCTREREDFPGGLPPPPPTTTKSEVPPPSSRRRIAARPACRYGSVRYAAVMPPSTRNSVPVTHSDRRWRDTARRWRCPAARRIAPPGCG